MPIKQFGYIGIRTAKLGEWRTIATQVLGAQCRDDSPDGTLKLRFDSYHHRVTLYDAAEEQVAHYGWQLESQQDLVRYGETLARHGVAWQPGSALECADRAVDSFIHFKDPDGQRVELFVTPHVDASGFQPSRGLGSGFAMDSLGLGHVNLACHDVQARVVFYVDVLVLNF
jgi:catechol 2,3-dioxygenase-like lactoylglutathione lyase family enzyme